MPLTPAQREIVQGGGELPADRPQSYEYITEILPATRESVGITLREMVKDEEKAVREYDDLIGRLEAIGEDDAARLVGTIRKDEGHHRDILEGILKYKLGVK